MLKPSLRKFYKTTVTVVVLSEDVPIEFDNLKELHHSITEGDCSGVIGVVDHKRLTGPQMARALVKQGSDPEFFSLNGKGEDVQQI